MSVLECTVNSCHYNRDRKCSRDSIQVEGEHARVSESTSCGSFMEKNNILRNAIGDCGCATKTCKIRCEAKNCTYNDACCCCADSIHMEGHNANTMSDTKCATFHER